jgi:DNA-binding IscR family transcriptional regulator
MLDVYEAIEGELEDTHCFFQVRKCESGCVFGSLMRDLNQQVRDQFGSTTLRAAADKLSGRRVGEIRALTV